MGADEHPIASIFVERWSKRRALESIEASEVEDPQARNREYDSGYDETLPRA